MATFDGFQDSVRKVIHARQIARMKELKPPEDEATKERRSIRRRSFQTLVKKVVQTQSTIRSIDHRTRPKHVLYPSRSRSCIRQVPVMGGVPITSDTATELRVQVFGSADLLTYPLSEWLGHPFSFHDADTALAYGLKVPNSSTKGLVMCVQAFILKHLLFSSYKLGSVGDIPRLLRTTRKAQIDALVAALSDILWKAGERQHAVLCLTNDDIYINEDPSYLDDGCTEKIVCLEFEKYEELKFSIKTYLFELVCENGHGLLLFLYSVILTRTFRRLAEDLDGDRQSLALTNTIHPCLATLLLTGRATRHLHNGIIYEGSEHTMSVPKTGTLTRAEVGLLVWKRKEDSEEVKVGSRLKTPTFPIWVTRFNDSYGVLFNPNKDLIRDYHAENRFDLYYYSSNTSQTAATVLTINTRHQTTRKERQYPPIEKIIHTKWQGADVNWNGTVPYV
ncbi:inactive ubiquitin carboxyl-terminal hydrolase MINDY-4B-like [Panulirus ornatus]|uniref:inactive ubiquitin carboxyl-terminal hydrolase MINDY-4B-like n=1 Tax=Panulirus ornatus TaxID=150431 RepID=UPI003A896827